MLTDLTMPFAFGLVSSLHCAQMCGPVVVAYSVAARGSVAAHLYYNTGRLATYAVLGAMAGAAGGGMGLVGRIAGVAQGAALAAGALMIPAGLLLLGAVPRQTLVRLERTGISRLFSRTVGRLVLSPHPSSKLLLGLLLGLLPCGVLYGALLTAVSTGTPAAGALSMLAFGAGTAMALMGIGAFSTFIGERLSRWSRELAGFSLLLMGAFLLWRGLLQVAASHGCHGS